MTLFLTIWAAVGPLVGIVIGHYLVRSWERKRWLADNRKEEYRRILVALNKVNGFMVEYHVNGFANEKALKEAVDESSVALNTSLFVNDFFEQSKVADDILQAARKFTNGGSFDDYHEEYWKAIKLILAAANKSTL